MSQISKYPIPTDVADRIFGLFIKSLNGLKSSSETADFAHDLFSPTERVMFAKRIAIAFLLLKEYKYRDISKVLRVSLGNVARVNLALKHGKGSYKRVLDKIKKDEELEDFFINIVERIISVPAKQVKGGGGWKYIRQEIEKEKNKNKEVL